MNNIITLINRNIKYTINKAVIDRLPIEVEEVEDFFESLVFRMECNDIELTKENIEEEAVNYVYEFVDETLPIYDGEIMEMFRGLTPYEIDEAVAESGWIEYNSEVRFVDFATGVVAYIKGQELSKSIYEILQGAEYVEFDREGYEEVKKDILKFLNNYRNIYVESLAEQYKKGFLSSIEPINHHICEMLYKDNYKFDLYKYYYIDFYNDKEIREAVRNY